ncbi:LPXTG cell wall anchor domain-containing protein [Curtobacterium sp. CT11-45]|uniref:LPXTG cell wall anchor domain-containing protein n=1 Tax=Curtobacterium sp. CT11-45 TaxID=3243037 RepID=UPI0039B05BEE
MYKRQGSGPTNGALAYTGADLTPGLIAAGVLVLLGGGLLTFRAVRNRRRTSHLRD